MVDWLLCNWQSTLPLGMEISRKKQNQIIPRPLLIAFLLNLLNKSLSWNKNWPWVDSTVDAASSVLCHSLDLCKHQKEHLPSKNPTKMESFQEFTGREENHLYFLPFSVSFFSPSMESKIINHLPADKISCLMREQLQHLMGSYDEVHSKFLQASPGLIQHISIILPNTAHTQSEW